MVLWLFYSKSVVTQLIFSRLGRVNCVQYGGFLSVNTRVVLQ